jgi:hypothetical protein
MLKLHLSVVAALEAALRDVDDTVGRAPWSRSGRAHNS